MQCTPPRESAFSFYYYINADAAGARTQRKVEHQKIVFTTCANKRGIACARASVEMDIMPSYSQPCNFLANFAQENEREFATFCAQLTPTGDGQLFDK
jgi:hypothetical protein